MVQFGLILALAGIIVFIIAVATAGKLRSFASCSEPVTGTIAGKFVHHGKNGKHYSFDVEYTVDGEAYKRSVAASLSEYNSLDIGCPLELKYKPEKPKKIIRADMLTPTGIRSMRILMLASGAATIIGVIMLFSRRLF